jgi:hypothetical protein
MLTIYRDYGTALHTVLDFWWRWGLPDASWSWRWQGWVKGGSLTLVLLLACWLNLEEMVCRTGSLACLVLPQRVYLEANH